MEGDTTWAGKYIDGGAELLIVRLRNLTYTAVGATTRARGGWQQHRLGYAFAGPRHLWRLGPLEGVEGPCSMSRRALERDIGMMRNFYRERQARHHSSRRGAVMRVLYTSCIFLRPHRLQRIEARVPDFCQHGREWYFQKVGMVYTIQILNSRRCVVAEASAKAVRLSVSVIASSLV